jgi:hypothetical protein
MFSALPAGLKSSIHSNRAGIDDALLSAFGNVPDILVRAFTGGGGMAGALKAVGSDVGAKIGGHFQTTIQDSFKDSGKVLGGLTKVFSDALPVIGSLVGPLIGLFGKLFENPEKQINPIREQFVQLHGGLANLNLEATRAGVSLTALLQAKNAEQYKKAIDDLNRAFDTQKAKIEADSSALGLLLKSGQDLGIALPDALKDSIQKLIDMGKISGDTADLFKRLTENTEVDFKRMSEVAGKYKIDLGNLGPAFQSSRLHDSAKTIINDFEFLTKNGADVGSVLAGMSGNISKLVTDSLKFGVEIPANMKPWIESLLLSGSLVDDNGDKITDLSGLKFSDPIVSEFQKIVDALTKLVDHITGNDGVVSAIGKIPKDVRVGVHFNVDNPPDWAGFAGPIPQARGGMGRVTKPTLFLAGEAGPENFAFSPVGKSFGSGGSDNSEILAELRGLRADQQQLLPRAIRDAVMLAG